MMVFLLRTSYIRLSSIGGITGQRSGGGEGGGGGELGCEEADEVVEVDGLPAA